jgi:SpoVK/Ycf46/Vps4 family AAA+-type ATPase
MDNFWFFKKIDSDLLLFDRALNNPEIYKAFGKKIGGGILLYGPPGCGKTHIARATAGEIKANFISVGISDVLDMWQGNSEKNLHSLFQKARNSTPCVLFFDEVDAMGASRSDMRSNSQGF